MSSDNYTGLCLSVSLPESVSACLCASRVPTFLNEVCPWLQYTLTLKLEPILAEFLLCKTCTHVKPWSEFRQRRRGEGSCVVYLIYSVTSSVSVAWAYLWLHQSPLWPLLRHTSDNNLIRYVWLSDVCLLSSVSLVFGIPTQNHLRVNVCPLCRLPLNKAVWFIQYVRIMH